MLALPGRAMPIASARQFIESAVPITLQCPALGAEPMSSSVNFLPSISPAANLRRASQMIVPAPASSPSR